MMKKLSAILVAMLLALSLVAVADEAESVTVYVTLTDAGSVELACQPITVTDLDGDGALTINDALLATHAEHCPDGFATAETEYGLSITKLWNNESGVYGYYLNNAIATGLDQAVVDGDILYAYSYIDVETYSDAFCFFTMENVDDQVVGTLYAVAFDPETYLPVATPVAGATITINGEDTDTVTAEDGTFPVSLTEDGLYIFSAHTDAFVMVPPVVLLTVGDIAAEE